MRIRGARRRDLRAHVGRRATARTVETVITMETMEMEDEDA